MSLDCVTFSNIKYKRTRDSFVARKLMCAIFPLNFDLNGNGSIPRATSRTTHPTHRSFHRVHNPSSLSTSRCLLRPFPPLNYKSLWTAAGPPTARFCFRVSSPISTPRETSAPAVIGPRYLLRFSLPFPSPRLSVCTRRFNGTLNRNKT